MKACGAAGVLALAVAAPDLPAQSYPAKPIRLILTTAPGGTAGLAGQLLGEQMSRSLGQPIVLDYRTGQQGSLGTAIAAKSPADGHTLLLVYSSTLSMNPWMYRDVGYDPVRDLAHIGLAGTTPLVVSVHPSVPAGGLRDLAALAKRQTNRIAIASGALGGQLAGKLFDMVAGVSTVTVSYKGGGAAAIDVAGGHVDALIASPPSSIPFVQTGRLRAIAVTGTSRLPALPGVATSKESGFPELEILSWASLAAPAGTPREIITRLNGALGEAVRAPVLRERFAAQGLDARTNTPDEMAAYVRAEYERWGRVIRAAGVTAE